MQWLSEEVFLCSEHSEYIFGGKQFCYLENKLKYSEKNFCNKYKFYECVARKVLSNSTQQLLR